MVQIPFDQMARIIIKEALKRRTLITFVFTLVTLMMLIIGLFWPKSYTSSTSIIADDKKIIRPLMQGNAVTTNISDQIRIAKEIIFSRVIMDHILDLGGWGGLTPVEKERKIKEIKNNTFIGRGGSNLIKLEYSDNNPERAFLITQKLAELFISENARSKREESSDAYDFIDKQVSIYHEKLTSSEESLKQLREENVDARPGSEDEVNNRISDLRNEIRITQLALKEAQIKKYSLEGQLSGEAKVAKNVARINFYRQRISELEMTLDGMRLSYHETYPDIIQLNNQITELQRSLAKEEDIARKDGTLGGTEIPQAISSNRSGRDRNGSNVNAVYIELRSQLSNTITQIATYQARIRETKQFLNEELARLQRISDGEARLAELTRDYEVHQSIYQDLLERREKARVSLHLQLEKQGLNFKIQEPANLPLTPSGMRFVYFAILGPILGIGIPLGLLYAVILLDGKIRYHRTLVEEFNIPLIGHIPHLNTPGEAAASKQSQTACLAMIAVVVLAYSVTGWLKFAQLF